MASLTAISGVAQLPASRATPTCRWSVPTARHTPVRTVGVIGSGLARALTKWQDSRTAVPIAAAPTCLRAPADYVSGKTQGFQTVHPTDKGACGGRPPPGPTLGCRWIGARPLRLARKARAVHRRKVCAVRVLCAREDRTACSSTTSALNTDRVTAERASARSRTRACCRGLNMCHPARLRTSANTGTVFEMLVRALR